jgi:hypothetical protein
MNLFSKRSARFAVLFLFAALLPALYGCHDAGNCVTAPVLGPGPAGAGPALGGAGIFAILASSTVTNTGVTTTISGDVGVSPGNTTTGIPAGQPTGGTIHLADATAATAQANALTAYGDLAGRPCNVPMSGVDLGGRTLSANVYCFSSTAQLTGTLTLDGQGNSNAVFVFQIGSGLTTAPNSAVVLTGGALAGNVYWQVGSAAVLDVGTDFVGTIIADAAVTLNSGATLNGRAISSNAAVTMDTNAIARP